MLADFFLKIREYGVPATLRELLDLLRCLEREVIYGSIDDFYALSRIVLVKDEKFFDRFDRAFSDYFDGIESLSEVMGEVPEDWLSKLAEKHLTDEEKRMIEALGGFDKVMEALKERLENQEKRHQGGNRNIGTAGTSPFGAHGYNPEGVRIGQSHSRHRRAIKVWDKREFKNYDGDVALSSRNMKVALRRLRQFARTGSVEELDIDESIRSTARNAGWLDLNFRPERNNAVKVLLLMDVGGSMDDHIREVEELFSAARDAFKTLDYYYFHNCVYESVWKNNRRRHAERIPTQELMNRYPADTRLILVGDATMSPYEIATPGGSVEHWNQEAGHVWLTRLRTKFGKNLWLNPQPEQAWEWHQSIQLVDEVFEGAMYPLTLDGLNDAMRKLSS